MIIPSRLYEGDTIGVISPAGPPNMEHLEVATDWLKQLGFQVRLGKNVAKKYGYLAGPDDERLDDFHRMFADDSVRAVICSRGGYGTARFADRIDYDLVRSHPKVFWGYSDITYLHTAIRQKTGLVTFHGPMLASDLGDNDVPLLSKQLFSQLFQPMSLRYDEHLSPLTIYQGGTAEGMLVGGNLTLLASSLGTDFEIETKDKLLFIEDIGEAPYRVDSMLNQLRLAGKLDQAAGFIIGDFHQNQADNGDATLTYQEVFQTYLGELGKPMVSGFMIGHCAPNFSIPFGVDAMLDADRKQLWIQPGVM
ncbi:S66 peptidase family protein [Sporolactobacillus nakayamae]|uniref:Muramoyltetrapeptide carboxypeptidase n=1 Tax=Sporolactobacillus nakayamae TaxID=269670 RepID=A0A1I2N5G8_9BACL|nr:LD-carboxypeptidase [Sporolactobacillus nakayamae]SFF98350.1 muramoyltetrapeptide carboxypeptidase [Sporolactobacillus nakayamae]